MMDRKGILHEAMNGIHLAEEKFQRLYFVHTAISLRVLQNARNTLNSWTTIRFSRQTLFNGVGYDMLPQNKNCVNMYLLSIVKTKSMLKVSKCHCLFNSNYSFQITLLTHTFNHKIPAKLTQPTGVLKHSRAPILCYGPTVKVWHVQTRYVVTSNDYAVTKRNCTTFR